MKKIILVSLAAASLVAMASPAAAQAIATGTVNITGIVGDKCQVVAVAGGATANYMTSRNLLDLSQADGTLEASGTLETRFGVAGTTAPIFRVVCTTAAPKVSVNATPLLHLAPALQASSGGYTGTVNYTATTKLTTVAGTQSVSDTTAAGSTDLTLASRLAASGTNVEITTSGYNAGTDLLNAGSYTGQIVVTISPI